MALQNEACRAYRRVSLGGDTAAVARLCLYFAASVDTCVSTRCRGRHRVKNRVQGRYQIVFCPPPSRRRGGWCWQLAGTSPINNSHRAPEYIGLSGSGIQYATDLPASRSIPRVQVTRAKLAQPVVEKIQGKINTSRRRLPCAAAK